MVFGGDGFHEIAVDVVQLTTLILVALRIYG